MKSAAIVYLSILLLATSTLKGDYFYNIQTTKNNKVLSKSDDTLDNPLLFYVLAAEMALAIENPNLALNYYQKATVLSQDPAVAEKATKLAIELHDPTALLLAKRWATLTPQLASSQIIVATLLLIEQQVHEASLYFQKALALDPKQLSEQFLALYRYGTAEQKNILKKMVYKLINTDPKNCYSLFIAAQLFTTEKNFKNALSYIEKSLHSNKILIEAIRLKVDILLHNKQTEKSAILFLEKKLKIFPENIQLNLIYAKTLLQLKKTKKAIFLLKSLTLQHPSLQEISLLLAKSYRQAGNVNQAISILKSISTLEYQNTANYLLGEIFSEQQQLDKSLQCYASVKEGPYHFQAYLKIIHFLSEHRSYRQALDILEQTTAITLEEQKILALTKIEVLIESNKLAEALYYSENLLTLFPNDTDILYSHALAALGSQKIVLAENDLREILSIYPQHIQALNTLGFLLLTQNRIEEAKYYLTHALILSPHDPFILDSVGWLNYQLGHLSIAKNFLRKAYAFSQSTEIAAHFAEVLWLEGEKKQAISILKTAFSKNIEDPYLLATLERLKININILN